MSSATSPVSGEPEPPEPTPCVGPHEQLAHIQDQLEALGATVHRTLQSDTTVAPKLAAERRRLHALRNP